MRAVVLSTVDPLMVGKQEALEQRGAGLSQKAAEGVERGRGGIQPEGHSTKGVGDGEE
jgi:hypothetical protein